MNVKVNMGRVPALMQKLKAMQGFKTGTKTAFVHLKSKLAKYPPRSSRPQAQFWTKKQRQGFFWHLAQGNIQVPYPRGTGLKSERLAQRWIVEGDGFDTKLHNRASYASRVQGRHQTAYHKQGSWKRVDTVIAEERQSMKNIVVRETKKDLVA
jgi:hypothetical protein